MESVLLVVLTLLNQRGFLLYLDGSGVLTKPDTLINRGQSVPDSYEASPGGPKHIY